MYSRSIILRAIAAACVVGLAIGYSIASMSAQKERASLIESFRPLRLPEGAESLIHPLFAYETPEATSLNEYKQLKDDIRNFIASRQGTDSISSVAMYYRNLNTGAWIGINENAYFYPASLLKVPVMIAYFKEAESDPAMLTRTIVYKSIKGGDPFEAESTLVPGTRYSARELMRRMIVDSDNGATYTLLNAIDSVVLDGVYTDLGITKPGDDTSHYQISTKTYALFFRILYNATYLSPAYSKEALTLLTKTTFENGLTRGLPEGTVVAHKFGEHVVSHDRATVEGVELHDCGIVYGHNQNYLLCVMTNAKTVANAEALIADIAQHIYESIATP